MKKNKEFAMYKGDELLGIGTAKELAEKLNVKVETIRFYNTPTYKKRVKQGKNRKVLVEIEDDE